MKLKRYNMSDYVPFSINLSSVSFCVNLIMKKLIYPLYQTKIPKAWLKYRQHFITNKYR